MDASRAVAIVPILALGTVSAHAVDTAPDLLPSLSEAAACGTEREETVSTDCLLDRALSRAVNDVLMGEMTRFAGQRGKELFGEHFRLANRLSWSPSGAGLSGDIDAVFPVSFSAAREPAPDGRRLASSALFLQWGVTRWTDGDGTRRDDMRYGMVRRFALSDTPGGDVLGISAMFQQSLEHGHGRLVAGIDYAGAWGSGWLHRFTPTTGWRPSRSGFEERALAGMELGLRVKPTTTIALESALTRWESEDGFGRRSTGARIGISWRPHPWLTFRTAWEDTAAGEESTSIGVVFSMPLGGDQRKRPRWEGLGLGGGGADSETNAPDIWRPIEHVGRLQVAERSAPVAVPTPASTATACRAGQTVRAGERCTYPGTSLEFTVLASGSGRLGFFITAGTRLNIVNTTINGQRITFVASRQADGSWLIERVGDSESPGFAPADQAAFDALVVGKTIRATVTGTSQYTELRFLAGSRFVETESGGTSYAGRYSYRNTGRNTGTLTTSYDDGDRCVGQLTFTSATAGRSTFRCDEGESGSADFRVIESAASDTAPTLDGRTDDQTYAMGTAIAPLTLPAATGGNGALSYTLAPAVPGLSFDPATRRLSGTPTQAGAYPMTYRAGDADDNTLDSDTATLTFTITVGAAATSATCEAGETVRSGERCTYPGTDLEFTVLASGSGRLGSYTAGTGLNLVNTTVNGQRITFVASRQADGSWLIARVGDGETAPPDTAPLLHDAIAPPTYTVGRFIPALTLPAATGGEGALSYTLTPAVPGLSFNAATRRLSGRPTQAGTYPMTYRVSDAGANTATRTFTLTVQGAGDFAPRMFGTVDSQTYTAGTAISARTLPLAFGGNGAVTYTLTPAVPGLSFNAATRRLSGTPTQAGTYAMTYRAGDADANTADTDTATRTFTITVQGAGDFAPRMFGTVAPAPYTVGTAIVPLTLPRAFGGNGTVTYTLTPEVPGLSFDPATRRLGGTPTEAGTWRMTYRAGDADANTADTDTATRTFTLTVEAADDGGADLAADLVVQSASVSDAGPDAGAAFTLSATVRNAGDGQSAATTLRYYRSSDATISASDTAVGTDAVGALSASGTSAESIPLTAPASAGTYYYGACVDTVAGESDTANNCSASVTVTVGSGDAPSGSAPLLHDAIAPPTYTVGRFIPALTLPAATGGEGALSYTLTPAVPGLSFNPTTRRLSGTPTQTGTYPMTYRVSDAATGTATRTFTITVQATGDFAPRMFGTVDSSTYTAGTAIFARTLPLAFGGNGALTYTLTPAVPGLSFNPTTRRLGGTPTEVGTYPMTYRTGDADANTADTDTATRTFTITVESAEDDAAADLVVQSPSLSDARPDAGAAFTLSATVRNQGSGPSAATTLRYYRSSDTTISTSDTAVGTDVVGALSASGTSAESIRLTAPSSAGTYYYGACVDTVAAETSTANNCSAPVTLSVSPDDTSPDTAPLLHDAIAPPTYTVGRAISSLTLPAATGGDGALSYTLIPAVPGLSFNPATRRLSGTPTHTGTYRMTYRVSDADANTRVSDTDTRTFTVTVRAASDDAPDLIVESTSVGDDSVGIGAYFTLSVTVRNQGIGDMNSSTTLRYHRSSDATIDSSDTQVGTDYVGYLDASETSDESIRLTAPSAPGTYYFGACVDAISSESDIGNNCSDAVAITVGGPDLIVESTSVGDDSVGTGAYFTLSVTVRNQGIGDMDSSTTLRYYRSSDATIDSSDTQIGTDYVGYLDASETSDESIRLTAPSAPGTYYFGACVDAISSESDIGNNCSDAVAVTVGGPDLIIQSSSVDSDDVRTGGSFTLSVTVRNQGIGDMDSSTTLRYYRSSDATIDSSDAEVGTDYVSYLDASETEDDSIRLTASTDPGTYYYGACIDGLSNESDSANNCSDAVTITVHFPNDLMIESLSAGNSAIAPGQAFTLRATVRNQGQGRAPASTLRFYRSSDVGISASDMEVGVQAVNPIAASSITTQSVSLTAPTEAGRYVFGACVDENSYESDTGNNCSGISITVGDQTPPPELDLTITHFGAPSTVTINIVYPSRSTPIRMNLNIRNRGEGAALPTTLRFSGGRSFALPVPALEAGAVETFHNVLVGRANFGSTTYTACVDVDPAETNARNNCSSRRVTYF